MRASVVLRIVLPAVVAIVFAGCSPERKKAALLERADKYYRAGDFEKARIEYQNVLQQDPENNTAIERTGLIWLDGGVPMRAAPFLHKAKRAQPSNLELRLKMAQLALSLGKVDEARKEALAIVERSSSVPDAFILLTESIRNQEDYRATEQAMRGLPNLNTVPLQIASANLVLLRGNATQAKMALQRAVDLGPNSAAAHSAMGGFHVLQNNPSQAAAEFKIAADLSPIRSPARVKYAGFLAQTGALPEAVAYLDDLIRQAPDYLPASRTRAQIAVLERKPDEALALLQTVISREPMDYEARILRAQVRLVQGDTKRAIEELEQIGTEFPGFALAKYQLAQAHLRANDEAKAIVALQETIVQNPDHVEAILTLGVLNLRPGAAESATSAMAELLAKRPNVQQAYPVMLEALKISGRLEQAAAQITESAKRTPQNAQTHYLRGLVMLQLEKPAEARQSFETAVDKQPNLAPAITELVNLDIKERKFTEAVQHAKALTAKAPEFAAGWVLLAKAFAGKGEWDEVEVAAAKAIELGRVAAAYALVVNSFAARKTRPDIAEKVESFVAKLPNDELAVVVGAQAFIQMEKFAAARDLYERGLAVQPNSSVVLNNLANLYDEQLGDSNRALELARKARKLQPASPVIADTLGWILYRRKEFQEAWTVLHESASKLRDNAEAQYHFGMASRAVGKNEEALAAFRVVVRAPGEFAGKDEAKRQLAQLEQGSTTTPSPTPAAQEAKSK